MNKKLSRKRRSTAARMKMRSLNAVRLTVNRTPRHIYAQLVMPHPTGDKIIAAASTLDKELREEKKRGGNIHSAIMVGKLIATRALTAGITEIAFDRSGFKYHGCIKAIADAAREAGLKF
jgi:large subunit ribosomal protein L18